MTQNDADGLNLPYAFQYRSLAAALAKMPFDARWMEVVQEIGRELKRQNPRFVESLWMEWVLEDK